MNLGKRVDELEHTVITHLEESGEIRADLKWLKKGYFAVIGAVCVEMAAHWFK